jgi:aspartate aminotransferase
MAVAKHIVNSLEKSSWIRKMFEEGARLKKQFGDENVFDFSLGNPDVDPPQKFFDILKEMAQVRTPGVHGYMPNAGFPDVCAAIAGQVSRNSGRALSDEHIVMTCGAAGGLNVVLKTILNPGDNIIVPRPYFVEYGFYAGNHGGTLKIADTNEDFSLNVANIKKLIDANTRGVLINSPNNPTGRIYSEKEISELSRMLMDQGGPIYLISDEPYKEIVYTDRRVPSILAAYDHSIVVNSYSKSLSLPGERIGYIAVNPSCADITTLMAGLIMSNRILGYVNAPALMQRIVAAVGDVSVDVASYRKRRDLFVEGLKDSGYSLPVPDGAFYIFCKSPIEDDVAFVKHLLKYNVLVVPGVGFGGPGYFRIAYCVPEAVIAASIPKFRQALTEL